MLRKTAARTAGIFRRYLCTGSADNVTGSEWAKLKSIRKSKLYLPQSTSSSRKNNIAILVGWARSNHKSVAKYASLYTKRGLPAIAVIPSLIDYWSSNRSAVLTASILNGLPQQCGLILHLFSGATTVLLPPLTNSLKSSNIKVKGIIFDSGPTEFSYEAGMNAARLTLEQGGFNKLTYTVAILYGMASEKLAGNRKRQEDAAALQSDMLNDVHQLYLCSEIDPVCPIDRVERIVKEQREMGRSVDKKCWKDSMHVRHLMKHHSEYEQQINAFIEKIAL